MRFIRCVLWFLVLVFSVHAFSQTAQVVLDLGPVTVWLGMPKSDVLEKFSNAGYEVTDMDHLTDENSNVVSDGKRLTAINKTVFRREDSSRNVYAISFAAGRLSYAQRSWFDEKDTLGATIEAIGAVTEHDRRSCSITYSPISGPTGSARRVFIRCGKISLLLLRGEMKQGGSIHAHFEISESIGNPPDE
jgi:hypothetical protein